MCLANLDRSFVIDTIKAQRSGNDVALAFFYCKRDNDPDRQDPDAILRAIVKQLARLRNELPLQEAVVEEYNSRKQGGFSDGPFQLEESRDIILKMTKIYPEIIIVLDALDECDKQRRGNLIDVLRHVVNNASNIVKIFISSRDDDDIVLQLKMVSDLRIKAVDNIKDIERFVNAEVSKSIRECKLLRGKVDEKLKSRLINTLINGANGM